MGIAVLLGMDSLIKSRFLGIDGVCWHAQRFVWLVPKPLVYIGLHLLCFINLLLKRRSLRCEGCASLR